MHGGLLVLKTVVGQPCREPCLGAQDAIGMPLNTGDGFFHVDVTCFIEIPADRVGLWMTLHPYLRDIEQRVNLFAHCGHDVAGEGLVRKAAGRTGVQEGGNSGGQSDSGGVHGKNARAVIDVRMKINQSRGYEETGGVHNFAVIHGKIDIDGLDAIATKTHVTDKRWLAGPVKDCAATDQC